nr:flagellar hook-basal body protein [uncultured Anaerotignum sp.]
MDLAFYAAAAGAAAQQKRLNVVANNLSNLSTVGFKKETAVFSNLIYNELNPPAQEGTQLSASSGSRVEKTNTDFTQGELLPSNLPYDYVLTGDGFFALKDPATGQVSYTRDGSFCLSQQADGRFLLTAQNGKHVLDTAGEDIAVDPSASEELPVGVYCFRTRDGMLHMGDNEYLPTEKNGNAVVAENSSAMLLQGYTENSNVNMADEIEKMIEAQRAYQYALKMVQTSDEIENTINNLRG